ncbi:hypothetical protein SAMN05216326_11617 [Nitrosomonas marina]|uniref:Uncharacterized protein n=1 Tax=Nitrosomonas marina TaxID=917 RepID=A0A1I0CSR0_9PROT|nr:hypothetical protein SAMN05216326_11617 [Nitrosomonas marina]
MTALTITENRAFTAQDFHRPTDAPPEAESGI